MKVAATFLLIGNVENLDKLLVSSKKHLLDGNSMLIFPEGKRNLSPQLLQFKPGAFKLAEECKLKVLPIVISGATDLFEKGTLIPKKGHIHLKILEPISIGENESVRDFADRARELIQKKKLYRRAVELKLDCPNF